jgi:hypothetical protein
MAPTTENAPPVAAGRGEANYQNKPAHLTALCPRQARALAALLRGKLRREELDKIAGVSNGPDLVGKLRRRGLAIPCEMAAALDRDGRPCKFGVYHLTDADRVALARWRLGARGGR